MKREVINTVVGRVGLDFYVLAYVFGRGEARRGVVGVIVRPISVEERDEYMDIGTGRAEEHLEDMWREMAYSGRTTKGLTVWVEETIAFDGESAFFDIYYGEAEDELDRLVAQCDEWDGKVCFWEEVSGGRVFHKDIRFDEVYNENALRLIGVFEGWYEPVVEV